MRRVWAARSITSSGPLTNITISETLNCSVNHADDVEGEFFNDTACGTLLAAGGSILGPASIPFGASVTGASNYVASPRSTSRGHRSGYYHRPLLPTRW